MNGPFALPAPGPGQTWPIDHFNAIYRALTLDACGLSVSFPITMDSWIVETVDVAGVDDPSGAEIGRVSLSDGDTLDRPGLYNFAYTIRANGTNGGVSEFGFSGIVSVRCTSETEL